MSISVHLQVPPSVYRLAKKTAEATSRPVEQVLVDVLSAASPGSEDLPQELQTELDAFAQLSDNELLSIARRTFPADQRRIYDRLLKKNSAGTVTSAEREQLKELRQASEHLMLQKAHTYAILKWRGHVLPSLTKVPRPK
jgi:hypothetical protein